MTIQSIKQYLMGPADAVSFVVLSAVVLTVWWIRRKRHKDKDDGALSNSFLIGVMVSLAIGSFVPEMLLEIKQDTLVGIATIVVFSYLPFAVASLQNSDDEFYWDKQVLTDSIINLPLVTVMLVMGLIFPILFWRLSAHEPAALAFLFGVFVMAIGVYLGSILKIYGWAVSITGANRMTYRARKRLDHLANLPDSHKRDIWTARTWQRLPKQPVVEQESLIEIFGQHIQDVESQEDMSAMIDDLVSNLHLLPLHRNKVYKLIFGFAFSRGPDSEQSDELIRGLRQLEEKIVDVSFDKKGADCHQKLQSAFFDQCRGVLNSEAIDKEKFTSRVAELFLSAISDVDRKEVAWAEFPEDWKVTLDNLTSKNKRLSSVWLNEYRERVDQGTMRGNELSPIGFNQPTWKITTELLPTASLHLWLHLLNLRTLIPDLEKNQAQTLINGVVLGYSGFHGIHEDQKGFIFEGGYDYKHDAGGYYGGMATHDECREAVRIYRLSGISKLRTKDQVNKYIKVAQIMADKDSGNKESNGFQNLNCLVGVLQILKSHIE